MTYADESAPGPDPVPSVPAPSPAPAPAPPPSFPVDAPGMLEPPTYDGPFTAAVRNAATVTGAIRTRSGRGAFDVMLLPAAAEDGRILSRAEAGEQYQKTQKHLGVFRNDSAAERYARDLYQPPVPAPAPPDPPTPPGMLTDAAAEAIQGAGGPDAAPEPLKNFFRARMAEYGDYRDQHPRRADVLRRESTRRYLEDTALEFDNIIDDDGNPLYIGNAANPIERQEARDRFLVDLFVRTRTGGSYEGPRRDVYRDAIARTLFDGAGVGSDEAFARAAPLWARRQVNERTRLLGPEKPADRAETDGEKALTQVSLAHLALTAALKEDPFEGAFAAWQNAARSQPDFDPARLPVYQTFGLQLYSRMEDMVDAAKPWVDRILDGLYEEKTGPRAVYGGEDVTDQVMGAPAALQPVIFSLLYDRARLKAERKEAGGQFFQAFGRGMAGMLTGTARTMEMSTLAEARKTLAGMKPGDEYGGRFTSLLDYLRGRSAPGVEQRALGFLMEPLLPDHKATAADLKDAALQLDVAERRVAVGLSLEQLGKGMDPIKGSGWWQENVLYPFAESLLPQMAVFALTRSMSGAAVKGGGLAAGAINLSRGAGAMVPLYGLMADQNAQQLMQQNPGLPIARAYELGREASYVQTGLEYAQAVLTLGGAVKLRGLGELLRQSKTAAWKTFLKTAAVQTVEQSALEGVQDIMPQVVAALHADVPGQDWDAILYGRKVTPGVTVAARPSGGNVWTATTRAADGPETTREFENQEEANQWAAAHATRDGSGYWSQRLDTFYAFLPAIVLHSLARTRGISGMEGPLERAAANLTDELLHAAGLQEGTRAAILAEKDPVTRLDALSAALPGADQSTASEGLVRLDRQRGVDAARLQQTLADAGVTVEKTRLGDVSVYRVTARDGQATDHATLPDAMETASTHLQTRDETFLAAAARLLANAPEGRAFEFRGETRSLLHELDEALAGGHEADIDAIWQRAEIFRRAQDPAAAPLARDAADPASRQALDGLRVLGRSRTAFGEKVARSVSTLFSGGGVIDLVEEESENNLRESIGQGDFGWHDMAAALRHVESVTGDTYLHGDSPAAITEGWSALVRLYATGTRRAQGGNEVTGAVRQNAASATRDARRRLRAAETGGHLLSGLAQALRDSLAWMKATFGAASRLLKARQEGHLSPGLEAEIRKSLALEPAEGALGEALSEPGRDQSAPQDPVKAEAPPRMSPPEVNEGELTGNPTPAEIEHERTSFSLKPFEPSPWGAKFYRNKLAAWERGEDIGREEISLGATPPVLRAAGAGERALVMPPSVFEKATTDKHAVTKEVLRTLPEALANPVAVFQSRTHADALVVLTEHQEEGRPVIVAVHLDRAGPNKLIVNRITSVYAKRWQTVADMFAEAPAYLHEEKSRAWARTARNQFPGVRIPQVQPGPNTATPARIVNLATPASLTGEKPAPRLPTAEELTEERTSFSVKPFEPSPWGAKFYRNKLAAWERGEDPGREEISMGATPPVLRAAGADELALMVRPSLFQKVTADVHAVPLDALRKLPEAIADPIAVLQSRTDADSLVVLTELHENGNPLIAAVHLNRSSAHGLIVNRIVSVYGKNKSTLADMLARDPLLYLNEQKSRAWARTAGVQFPRGQAARSGGTKHATPESVVKSAASGTPSLPGPRSGTSFALTPRPYAEAVKDALAGRLPPNAVLDLGKPGPVLLSAGLPDLPLRIRQRTVRRKSAKHNELTAEVMKALPAALNAPMLVYTSPSDAHAHAIVTSVQTSQGPVVACFSVRTDQSGSDVLDAKTVFGKKPGEILEELGKVTPAGIRYQDEKALNGWLASQVRSALSGTSHQHQQAIESLQEFFHENGPAARE